MAKTTYLAYGQKGAERIANMYRDGKNTVTVDYGSIPQWGSAIPTSSTYGKTEMGYKIVVDDHQPAHKPIITG